MKYIDGRRLRRAVVAAAQRVLETQERLNRINVFPVPDGDTGTNMALTLKSVADGAIEAGDLPLETMSQRVAELALMGARGNSGAILAQFFHGLAEGFRGRCRVDPPLLIQSVELAVRHAQEAVLTPVEGTILTVMRDWSTSLRRLGDRVPDLGTILKASLEDAITSLTRTKTQLKVLARAGVVDAGAQGFVNMLEGVVQLIHVGPAEWRVVDSADPQAVIAAVSNTSEYRFCSECLVEGESLELGTLRAAVSDLGDSLIVAGGATMVRIHIHTNQPELMFERVQAFGSVSGRKADDMQAQQDEIADRTGLKPALVMDSSADLPTDFMIRHHVRVVPVSVSFGPRVYLDRVTITGTEVYRLMRQSRFHPKTSQPTPGDFVSTYQLAREHHRDGIAILISGALSGTYQSAVRAARSQQDIDMRVIDSRNAAGAHGLLVMLAAELIEQGLTVDEVQRRVEAARTHTIIFAALQSLDAAVRGGRVGRVQGWIARTLGLVPVLCVDGRDGKIRKLGVARPSAVVDKMLVRVIKRAAELDDLRIIVSHASAEAQATAVAERLARDLKLPPLPVLSVSPTLGAHVGPGTVTVAMLGFPQGPTEGASP